MSKLSQRGNGRPLQVSRSEDTFFCDVSQRYSIGRAIRMHAERGQLDGIEGEASRELERRIGVKPNGFLVPSAALRPISTRASMVVGTANIGGNLVGTEFRPDDFIEALRARSVIAALGASVLPGLTGNVAIPKQTASATAAWVAEGSGAAQSNLTFGQLTLSPKQVTANVEYSLKLLRQGLPSIDQLVTDDLTRQIALAIDAAAINGSGANTPTGILGTAGIGSVTGTTLGLPGIVEFQTDVAAANALGGQLGYLTTPAVAGLLMQRQRFASTDTPLWEGSALDGRVAGYRAITSTQVPAATMLFGDFSQIVIGEWGAMDIVVDPYSSASTGQVKVAAHHFVDIGVRQAAAFSAASTIT